MSCAEGKVSHESTLFPNVRDVVPSLFSLFCLLVELAGTFLEAIYRKKTEKKTDVRVVWCLVRK